MSATYFQMVQKKAKYVCVELQIHLRRHRAKMAKCSQLVHLDEKYTGVHSLFS